MAAQTAIERHASQSIDVTQGSSSPLRQSTWSYRPNVDIFDTPDALLLVADLPGAQGENIDLSFESGILTIQAIVEPRTRNGASAIVSEYGVGHFHRRFEIDESIDTDNIKADYRDGTLTVHLPKSSQARRRRIPVTSA